MFFRQKVFNRTENGSARKVNIIGISTGWGTTCNDVCNETCVMWVDLVLSIRGDNTRQSKRSKAGRRLFDLNREIIKYSRQYSKRTKHSKKVPVGKKVHFNVSCVEGNSFCGTSFTNFSKIASLSMRMLFFYLRTSFQQDFQ